MHVGKIIKQIRISKRLKPKCSCNSIKHECNCLRRYEREKTLNISIQRLEQIAKVLEVPLTEILNTNKNTDDLLKRIDDLKQELENKEKELKYLRGGVKFKNGFVKKCMHYNLLNLPAVYLNVC